MGGDDMLLLRRAKPPEASVHLLDPEAIERVRVAALRDPVGIATLTRAHRASRLLSCIGVVAAVTAAIAGVLAALPGNSVSPATALSQATQRTEEFTSGRIAWTITKRLDSVDGPTLTTQTTDVRYDKSDFAIDYRLTQRTSDKSSSIALRHDARAIDGRLYTHSHEEGPVRIARDAPTAIPGRIGDSARDALSIQRLYMDELADAVQSHTDVAARDHAGATTYTANLGTDTFTVPASIGVYVDKARIPRLAPLLVTVSGNKATVEVTVSKGVVRGFTVDNHQDYYLRATVSGLGAPQAITARFDS